MAWRCVIVFIIDPVLRQDCVDIAEFPVTKVLLMDDERFPWVILVPTMPGAEELSDLDETTFEFVNRLSRDLGVEMKNLFGVDKINTAAIGNVVRQLHIHIVGRRVGDDVWPAPVWGQGQRIPMSEATRQTRLQALMNSTAIIERNN